MFSTFLVTLVDANLQDSGTGCLGCCMLILCYAPDTWPLHRGFNIMHHVFKQDTRSDFFALLRTKLSPLLPKKVASWLIELR